MIQQKTISASGSDGATLLAMAAFKLLQVAPVQPLTRIAMWLARHQLKSKTPARRLRALKRMRVALNHAVVSLDDMITITLLDHVLTDTEMEIRREAATTLGDLQDLRTLRPLTRALNDHNEAVQETAIEALKQLQDRAAVPPLVTKLLNGQPNVQWRAALALKSLKWEPKTEAEQIRFHLALGEIKRLALFGGAAVQPIVEMLRNGPSEKKIPAINVLGEIADAPALKALQFLLRDGDALVRTAAIYALERTNCHAAAPGIVLTLKDSVRNVRLAAAAALGTLGDAQCVEPLLKLLDDRDWEIRRTTLESLGRLGDRRAVQPMARHLKDSDQEVREVTADALGRIGDDSILEKLVLATIDAHGSVRSAAVRALNRINPRWESSERVQQMLPEIKAAMNHRDPGVQTAAANLFRRVNRPAPDAVNTTAPANVAAERREKSCAGILQALLEDTDTAVRLAAIEIIARLKLADGADALRVAAKDTDESVKLAAQQALAAFALGNDATALEKNFSTPLEAALLCSLHREVLHQSGGQTLAHGLALLEFISTPAEQIRVAMSLGEFQRLEMVLPDARLVLATTPDGSALVRLKNSTTAAPMPSPSTTAITEADKEQAADWLRRTASGRGVLLRGIRFPDQTVVCDMDSRGLTTAALEQAYGLVAETFTWLATKKIPAAQTSWSFSRGALHCSQRKDGSILGALASVRPGDTDLSNLRQQLAAFQSLAWDYANDGSGGFGRAATEH